jgi:hypothetical protein
VPLQRRAPGFRIILKAGSDRRGVAPELWVHGTSIVAGPAAAA